MAYPVFEPGVGELMEVITMFRLFADQARQTIHCLAQGLVCFPTFFQPPGKLIDYFKADNRVQALHITLAQIIQTNPADAGYNFQLGQELTIRPFASIGS